MSTTSRQCALIMAGLLVVFSASCQAHQAEDGRAIGGFTPEEMYLDVPAVRLVEAVLADDGSGIHQITTEGADVNSLPDGGVPPLIWAVHFDRLNALNALLAAGADACQSIPTLFGDSALVVAVRTNKLDQLKIFLSAGADPNCPISDEAWPSVLWVAISDGSFEMVRLLVEAGADVNVRNGLSSTVLTAQALGKYEIALYLLEHGYHHSLEEVALSAQRRLVSAQSEGSRQAVISYLKSKGIEFPVRVPVHSDKLDESSSD